MYNKSYLGAIIGALLMLSFALGPMFWLGFSDAERFSQDNLLFSLVMMLLSPMAGGFIAGLINKPHPKRSGLLAGLAGSTLLFAIWLAFSGISLETLVNGAAVIFVWMFLAQIGAGLSASR